MFTTSSSKRHSQSSATRRVNGKTVGRPHLDAAITAERGGLQNNRDFSIRAYQQFDAGRSRAFEALSNSIRALKRVAATLIRRLLAAMLESRRKQIAVIMAHSGMAIGADCKSEASRSGKHRPKWNAEGIRFEAARTSRRMRIRCAVTGAPCQGDLAHLCYDWGCARKGGLSPVSHENF